MWTSPSPQPCRYLQASRLSCSDEHSFIHDFSSTAYIWFLDYISFLSVISHLYWHCHCAFHCHCCLTLALSTRYLSDSSHLWVNVLLPKRSCACALIKRCPETIIFKVSSEPPRRHTSYVPSAAYHSSTVIFLGITSFIWQALPFYHSFGDNVLLAASDHVGRNDHSLTPASALSITFSFCWKHLDALL